MNELIHKNCCKLMSLLVDVEEWGQIVIGSMTQFTDPNLRQMTLQMKMMESSMRTAMMIKRKMMRKQQSSCTNWIPIAAYCCAVPRQKCECGDGHSPGVLAPITQACAPAGGQESGQATQQVSQ
jgi:hypothetical protein